MRCAGNNNQDYAAQGNNLRIIGKELDKKMTAGKKERKKALILAKY